jgi:hypothetical protein
MTNLTVIQTSLDPETVADDLDWVHHGVRLEVLRMCRADLHNIRPGISLDYSYDPDGLDPFSAGAASLQVSCCI